MVHRGRRELQSRFLDNGWYVGHDEPDIGFFSNKPGSSNNMTYTTVLPVDPPGDASASPNGPTHEFELTPARWFGLTMCDNQSYPEGTKVCKPDSDSNVQVPPRPDHAGAAFMELQMYPPGFAPAISCDSKHWCAALTIDSLQANFGALHGPDAVAGRDREQQLRRAGQLRLPDPQRQAGRTARARPADRGDVQADVGHADDESR